MRERQQLNSLEAVKGFLVTGWCILNILLCQLAQRFESCFVSCCNAYAQYGSVENISFMSHSAGIRNKSKTWEHIEVSVF